MRAIFFRFHQELFQFVLLLPRAIRILISMSWFRIQRGFPSPGPRPQPVKNQTVLFISLLVNPIELLIKLKLDFQIRLLGVLSRVFGIRWELRFLKWRAIPGKSLQFFIKVLLQCLWCFKWGAQRPRRGFILFFIFLSKDLIWFRENRYLATAWLN